jgi:hypothetical protein
VLKAPLVPLGQQAHTLAILVVLVTQVVREQRALQERPGHTPVIQDARETRGQLGQVGRLALEAELAQQATLGLLAHLAL